MHEPVTKRIIWVAACDCNPEDPFKKIYTENPPREVKCTHCDKWITPKEETYVGKDKFDSK